MADRPFGNLIVRVSSDVRSFQRGMRTVDQGASKLKSNLRDLGSVSPAALAAVGAAVIAVGIRFSKLAGDVEQIESRFDLLTGASNDLAEAWIDDFRLLAGVSSSAAKDMVANLTQIGQAVGLAEDESVKFALAIAKVAGDIGAFNDAPTADVARDIRRALSGSTEAMDKYGISLRQAEINQRAMANTGADSTAQLSRENRVMAAAQIIREQAGRALGNMALTQKELNRQSEILKGRVEELSERLSKLFLPIANFVVFILNKLAIVAELVGIGFEDLVIRTKALIAQLVPGGKAWSDFEEEMAEVVGRMDELFAQLRDGTLADIPNFEDALEDTSGALEKISVMMPDIIGFMERFRGVMDTVTEEFRVQEEQLQKNIDKINMVADAVSGVISVMRGSGSFTQKLGQLLGIAGAVVAFFNPLAGAAVSGGGKVISGFAEGGQIRSGQTGLVGEEGPELISTASGAQITPMGGGSSPINITIVTESGRKLIDTITTKQGRDADVRRIVRVPIAAMATG